MGKKIKKESKKQLAKTARIDIKDRLEKALAHLKTELGEKEFKKRAKKAASLFSDGLSTSKEPIAPEKKKKVKKAAEPAVPVEAGA